jgi:hypothetical protein
MSTLSGMFPIENSDLYQLMIEEKAHIERNRWYLSEKAGFDVGPSFAKYDWEVRHRPKWWADRTGKR